ncbi:MAG: outer membrane lipoprotein carrier protein LolA [Desulfobacteraceae bacterium]|nr:outer membrane lipoprotein carrier protein LolA [Desulfobacteraceae bacterium]MCB9494232.1 outer membrane lipoprotein carrier protein LolA [Desulfobacteraceae bacterium]
MKQFKYIFLIILLIPSFCMASSTDELVEKVEKRYSKKTFKADFFQESVLKALDIRQNAGGFVIFSHPGKMYWQYNFPDKQEIITNSETVWIYVHEDNQVTIASAGDYFKEGMGGSFLSNIGSISKNYEIKSKNIEDNDKALVILKPLVKGAIAEIEVLILKENGKILSVKTLSQSSDETVLIFKNEEFLTDIDENIFNFIPPKDVSITNF